MNNIKLTSVKLIKGLYDEFKVKTINTDMTFQKMVKHFKRSMNENSSDR